jgi:hypothetical protein
VIDALAALESATQTPLVEPVFDTAAALARFDQSVAEPKEK